MALDAIDLGFFLDAMFGQVRGAAMRASGLGREDEFAARPARHQAPVAPARFVVARQRPRRRRTVEVFEAELEAADSKRLVGRFGDLGDGLAQAAARQRSGAVMA